MVFDPNCQPCAQVGCCFDMLGKPGFAHAQERVSAGPGFTLCDHLLNVVGKEIVG